MPKQKLIQLMTTSRQCSSAKLLMEYSWWEIFISKSFYGLKNWNWLIRIPTIHHQIIKKISVNLHHPKEKKCRFILLQREGNNKPTGFVGKYFSLCLYFRSCMYYYHLTLIRNTTPSFIRFTSHLFKVLLSPILCKYLIIWDSSISILK